MIPYEEVEVKETEFNDGLSMSTPEPSSAEDTRPQQLDNQLFLRKREYRTARHMALMENQMTRKTSNGAPIPDNTTAV